MTTPFDEPFDASVGRPFDRQLRLGELIVDRGWQADLNAGTLRFGGDPTVWAELIGIESRLTETFLWARANAGREDSS